jgi:hypothetical protein
MTDILRQNRPKTRPKSLTKTPSFRCNAQPRPTTPIWAWMSAQRPTTPNHAHLGVQRPRPRPLIEGRWRGFMGSLQFTQMTTKTDSNRQNTPARGQGRPLNAFCPHIPHIVTPSVSENVLDGKNHAQPRSRVLSVDERSFERSTLIRLLSVKTAVLGGAASRAFERSFGAKPSAKTAPNVLPQCPTPKPPQNRAQNPSAQDQLPTPTPTPSDPTPTTPTTTNRRFTAMLERRAKPRQLRQLVSAQAPTKTTPRRSRCASRGSSAHGTGSTPNHGAQRPTTPNHALPRRQSIGASGRSSSQPRSQPLEPPPVQGISFGL